MTEPTSAEESTNASGQSRGLVITLVVILAVALAGAGWGIGTLIGPKSESRHEAATAPPDTGVDVGFARDMAAHHDQAVEMAGVTRDHTDDPEIRTMAFDIETSQLMEVGTLRGWLQAWGRNENTDLPRMSWMTGDSGMDHHGAAMDSGTLMPGMATEEQLKKLREAKGKDLDVQFLQLMIRHHQGGIPMARFAEEHATEPMVKNLGKKMAAAQSAEVVTMEKMLRQRGAEPLPPP